MTLPPQAITVHKGRGWRIAIGFVVSGALVATLFWLIDWRRVVAALGSMDTRWLALAALLLVACYVSQAIRWWFLLRCDPALPPRRLFAVLMMGLAVNVTLPLRPGDALRAYLIGHVYGGGTSRTVASLVLERILDVATMLVLGGLLAFKVKLPAAISDSILVLSLVVLAAVVAILSSRLFAKSASLYLRRAASVGRHRWTRTLATQLLEFIEALTLGGAHLPLLFALAVGTVGWAAFSAAMIACVAAFGLPAPATGGLLMVVLTNLGGVVPSSPGSIGIYHALAVLALSITGTPQQVALAVALVSHALIVGVQILLGLFAFSSTSGLVRGSITGRHSAKL